MRENVHLMGCIISGTLRMSCPIFCINSRAAFNSDLSHTEDG